MRRSLPAPKEILEELADKAATHIDRLAPIAFDAALDELINYHRFLLNVNASRTEEGDAFNYAAVPGGGWRAPYGDWIGLYRRLFERAADRIGDDPSFIGTLAHVPLRLLPRRDDPEMPAEVLRAILDLGQILIHRLEAWVTKRTVVETAPGKAASPRMSLAGSDAKAYLNLLPQIIGAWENLQQAAPSIYRWRDDRREPSNERWDSFRKCWPFLWQHLRTTAYMLAVSVWNEDEVAARLFRDALVRWPLALRHHFGERAELLQRRLLFPDILNLELDAARERIKPILPEYLAEPSPEELFSSVVSGAHDDVLLLTAGLLLSWSMNEKQITDIGARTAAAILRRDLEEESDALRQPPREKSFGALVLDTIRVEIAGGRRPKDNYGAYLDGVVEILDRMTERTVVPGRVYTPSTLHGREGLRAALLTMFLAKAPEKDDALIKLIRDLAKKEEVFPAGDQSLRDILHGVDRFVKWLETPTPDLQRGLPLLNADADFGEASARVKSILLSISEAIESERATRLRDRPVDSKAVGKLRDAAELAMTKPPGGVPFFRGFAIVRAPMREDGDISTWRYQGFGKGQFVDPPMEPDSGGLTEHYAGQVAHIAGNRAWGKFTLRGREVVEVAARIEDPVFWERVKILAADVGAEPIMIVSRRAEGRVLRELIWKRRETTLRIEKKRHDEAGAAYIATFEGVDVYGADFDPGKAWLFSPYLLRSLSYACMDEGQHVLRVNFLPDEDLKGQLVAEWKQYIVWEDWPIYEIDCDDPEQPTS